MLRPDRIRPLPTTRTLLTPILSVLDIIDVVPNAIVSHLFLDDEHANQALALEILEALKKCFATLRATDIVKITATFDAPYDMAGTVD